MILTFWYIQLASLQLQSLQKNKLLNSYHPLPKEIMSSSCIKVYLSAATVKVRSLHLHKVPYEITNIHAPRLHGQPLTNNIYMLPTHMIVTSIYNIIPGHVGIQPNEVIDQVAKSYAASFTTSQQSILDTDLTALKSALQQNLTKHWINSTPLLGV